jgi:hypothetical protein
MVVLYYDHHPADWLILGELDCLHTGFFLLCSICLFPGSLTQSLQSLSVLQCWEDSNTFELFNEGR